MAKLRQIWAWTRFIWSEYQRTGRFLVELGALIIFAYVFLRKPNIEAHLTATQFFGMTAIFVLCQTIFTTTMMAGLGNRPQGYVVLARSLGRKGYLVGLFLVAFLISLVNLILCTIIVTIINKPVLWDAVIWGAGALPLILDIALVTALVLLLSSLVLSQGWRLSILAVIALASLSTSDIFTNTFDPNGSLGKILAAIRTVVGIPLTPLFAGFELAVTRQAYESNLNQALAILGGQAALLIAVSAFGFFAFERRDIILGA